MRVEAVARAVLNRLLHEPTIRLRSFSEERGHASLQLVRELFGLDAAQRAPAEARTLARRRRSTSVAAKAATPLAEVRPRELPDDATRHTLPRGRAPRPARRDRFRIGTRGSALARAQARAGGARLLGGARRVVVPPRSGSRRSQTGRGQARGAARSPDGDKSRWVAELEQALLDGEIDLAVHSAKDVPGELATGWSCSGRPLRAARRGRADRRRRSRSCHAGARVGTSSVRRAAQLRAARRRT